MVSDIQSSSMNSVMTSSSNLPRVNWKQVIAFIGLTFGLTWSLDLILYLNGGLNSPAAILALQLQMLLPAFSAMLLGLFFFKDSKIYIKSNHATSRWFVWYFLFFTLLYIAASVIGFIKPFYIQEISSYIMIPSVLGLILVIVLRFVGGKESFSGVGLGGGKPKYWILFGLGILIYTGLQTTCNWIFKLGTPVDSATLEMQASMTGMSLPLMMVVITAQSLILGPFLGLVITFGEEYGWRGYLQPALVKIGRIKGVLLVGIIWGIWHWPVIWMGYNYPGQPILGSLLMVLFCIGLAFMLGYSVLKAKGIWIAAFLHALVNQSMSFFMGVIYTPTNMSFSFGIGFWGLAIMVPLVLLILLDPVWKEKE